MMKPTLISKPAFTVAGINWHGKMADAGQIPQLWEVFQSRAHELRQRVNPLAFYGVMGNSNEQTTEFDYMAGQKVENGACADLCCLCHHIAQTPNNLCRDHSVVADFRLSARPWARV